jgi:methyl-accepting chemotaxis protein
VAVLGSAVVLGATVGHDTVRQVQTLSTKARALRDGDLGVRVETDREDEFGDLFEAFEVMRRSLQRRIAEVERAREAADDARLDALAAKQESEAFSDHLEETAAAYGRVMAACADGDLTERIDHETESPAMRDIAQSFNAMMDDVQAKNDQLETVSHVLSHDLRNPLNVAMGRVELLAADVDSAHTRPVADSLDRIDTIIDDALVLALHSRIEETRPLTLWDAVQRAWTHVETGDARLELDGDVGFEADATLLGHVFENLFRNCVEHGSTGNRTATRSGDGAEHGSTSSRPEANDGVEHGPADDQGTDRDVEPGATESRPSHRRTETGTGPNADGSEASGVTIRAGPLDADGSMGTGGGFYVEDDGPGIPPELRDRIFETGFTTNRGAGGTGFGLAIVAKVVDAHGWTIRAMESDAGGARFEVSGLADPRVNESASESLA